MPAIKLIATFWYPLGLIALGGAFIYSGLSIFFPLKNQGVIFIIAVVFWVIGAALAQIAFGAGK